MASAVLQPNLNGLFKIGVYSAKEMRWRVLVLRLVHDILDARGTKNLLGVTLGFGAGVRI